MTSYFVTTFQSTERDGGRDGLGLLPLWSNLARQSIWNVTTISSDLAGWRSLLLAAWIAELVAPPDHGTRERALYAAERLIALARWHAPGATARSRSGVRGGTQVALVNGAVQVGGATPQTFLRSQESTGIVGQIGRPAIRSGLFNEDMTLSERSRVSAAQWYAALGEERTTLRRWLMDGAHVRLDSPLLSEVERAVRGPPPPEEADWWFAQVACARDAQGPTGAWQPGLQRCIATLLRDLHRTVALPNDPGALVHALRAALATRSDPDAPAVRAWLDQVVHAEALLGPMEALFAWLRTQLSEPRTRHDVVRALHRAWAEPVVGGAPWIDVIAPHIATHRAAALSALRLSDEEREEFVQFADAVARRDADATVATTVARNAAVTRRRGQREPWIIEHGGRWTTTFPGNRPALVHPHAWEHGYYLLELAAFVKDCGGAPS